MFRRVWGSILIWLCVTAYGHAPLQTVTVALDWYVNPDHAPLFVARQQGFYKKAGIKVKFITPSDPSNPPKWAAADRVDVAIDYQPNYLLQVSRGLPLTQVGTLIDKPLNCLVVLKSSGINTIQQLKGKTIGYSVGGIENLMLKTMLQHNGLSLKDIHLVNVHYALSQALLTHRIDAAIGMMRNIELTELQLMGQQVRAFYPENNGVPTYSELIFVTNNKNKHDPKIKRFLQAVALGVKYLKAHPQSTWRIFSKHHPEIDNTLNKKSWFITLSYFDDQPQKVNRQQSLRFDAYLQRLISQINWQLSHEAK